MEPIEGLDGTFLAFETGAVHLHVAAVIVLDPPEGRRSLFSPSTRFNQIRRVVQQRLHLVPAFRQRAVRVPFGLHHPVWADDPEFDLDDHLRRTSLPEPGGMAELCDLVADLVSRPLDLERPLWEMTVVEGLPDDRLALVAKVHHAILDGVSGAELLAAFFDLTPRPRLAEVPPPWEPEPLPGMSEMVRYAAGKLLRQPGAVLEALPRSVGAAIGVAEHNQQLAGDGEVPPPTPFRVPRTSINGTVSSRRRFAAVALPLSLVRSVRAELGTSVNDVVLACVAGAIRRLLVVRGDEVEGSLVAMVPVSVRQEAERGTLGNKVSPMLVSLATTVSDPVERLLRIAEGSRVAKARAGIVGARVLSDLADLTSPAVASRAARWSAGLRLFDRVPPACNLTVSNVNGPAVPLWCAGSRVAAVYPVGPLADGIGLNVTVMTYLGTMYVGLLGCRRLVPDVGSLAGMVTDALDDLVDAVSEARGAVG